MITQSDNRISYLQLITNYHMFFVNLTHARSIQELVCQHACLASICCYGSVLILCCRRCPQRWCSASWSEEECPSHMKASYPCSQTWISCVQAFLHEWMKWTRTSVFTFWEHSRKQPLSQHDSHDYSSRTNKIQPEEI